jgi:hypothetical protein
LPNFAAQNGHLRDMAAGDAHYLLSESNELDQHPRIGTALDSILGRRPGLKGLGVASPGFVRAAMAGTGKGREVLE